MALGDYLPSGCVYLPADLVQWTPEVRFVDVDASIFPDEPFDVVTMLGVIEYLEAPQNVFRHCRGRANSVVLSYCHPKSEDDTIRQQVGWVNAFSPADLSSLFELSGLSLVRSELYRESAPVRQMLYLLSAL